MARLLLNVIHLVDTKTDNKNANEIENKVEYSKPLEKNSIAWLLEMIRNSISIKSMEATK